MRKYFIAVKTGLSHDSRHRERMGNRVWLFLYIIDHVNWETGMIEGWKDRGAASEMNMPYYTLKQQRQELADLGYIKCVQKAHGQRIIVHNWINPRSTMREVINRKPVFGNDEEPLPLDVVGDVLEEVGDFTPPENREVGVEVGVEDQMNHPPLSIKDHTPHSHIEKTIDPIWDQALEHLKRSLNGTFEAINPILVAVDENPNKFTVMVNSKQPGLKSTIKTAIDLAVRDLGLRKTISIVLVTEWPGLTPSRRVAEVAPKQSSTPAYVNPMLAVIEAAQHGKD